MLQGIVKYLNITIFSGQEWIFQQDSVPAQKAKTIQEWRWRNLLAFISAKNWTINCGLFWRTWHVESVTRAWRA